jgi:Ca2+-binding EF-hand superfamily protein
LVEVYFGFDKDHDTYLNEEELGAFVKTYVPDLLPEEMNAVVSYLNNFSFNKILVSLY